MIKFYFLGFVLCVLLNNQVSGQTVADSSRLSHVITNYNSSISTQSRLYNGPEAHYYLPNIKGNAYLFDSDSFVSGSVNYDGIDYLNVPLLYDINLDAIVVLFTDKNGKFTLLKDYVKSFSLLDRHFVHIKDDSLKSSRKVASGYYEQLYAGKSISVFAKQTKNLQSVSDGNDIVNSFDVSKNFYLKKADGYYSFSSQGGLLDLLKDRKNELQQYIKTNKIKYHDNPEQAMESIASYYDHLTN